ncbi:MAG: hypothetical protein HUJ56_07470 [Erysipelotrichaceae bacterium]|nr:hypothetical protein [Erysipelotrichaceae bacterium]
MKKLGILICALLLVGCSSNSVTIDSKPNKGAMEAVHEYYMSHYVELDRFSGYGVEATEEGIYVAWYVKENEPSTLYFYEETNGFTFDGTLENGIFHELLTFKDKDYFWEAEVDIATYQSGDLVEKTKSNSAISPGDLFTSTTKTAFLMLDKSIVDIKPTIEMKDLGFTKYVSSKRDAVVSNETTTTNKTESKPKSEETSVVLNEDNFGDSTVFKEMVQVLKESFSEMKPVIEYDQQNHLINIKLIAYDNTMNALRNNPSQALSSWNELTTSLNGVTGSCYELMLENNLMIGCALVLGSDEDESTAIFASINGETYFDILNP